MASGLDFSAGLDFSVSPPGLDLSSPRPATVATMPAARTRRRWTRWGLSAALLSPACLDGSGPNALPQQEEPEGLVDVPLATPRAASFVTWNLETFPLTSQTTIAVAERIEMWRDDVIAVQEIIDVDTFDAMVDGLDGYEAVLNDDADGWMRVGLIYNADRVTVDNVETLFVGDGFAFPRPPLKADVTIELDDVGTIDFTVLVVHLKSQLGVGTQERRRAAADALHKWIGDNAGRTADRDIVVLGDFNEEVIAAPSNSAFEPFLTRPEQYSFLTYELNAGFDYSQLSYRSFLDHILITSDALSEYGDGATAVLDLHDIDTGYQESISDHLPVRAVFAPNPPPRRD